MPRYHRRRRVQKYTSAYRRARAAKSLVKLTKDVGTIKKKLKETYETHYIQNRGASTSFSADYLAINMLDYVTCRFLFGATASDVATCNHWKHINMKGDFIFTPNNEMSNVDLSVFVVTLKDEASALYDKSTGALTLTEGLHYAINDLQTDAGQTYLNPKCFNIHLTKRWIIGNNNIASNGPTGTGNTSVTGVKRRALTIKCNQMQYNPAGNVQSLKVSQDPSKQWYMLIFNNNSSADFEFPQVYYNIIHKIDVPN